MYTYFILTDIDSHADVDADANVTPLLMNIRKKRGGTGKGDCNLSV